MMSSWDYFSGSRTTQILSDYALGANFTTIVLNPDSLAGILASRYPDESCSEIVTFLDLLFYTLLSPPFNGGYAIIQPSPFLMVGDLSNVNIATKETGYQYSYSVSTPLGGTSVQWEYDIDGNVINMVTIGAGAIYDPADPAMTSWTFGATLGNVPGNSVDFPFLAFSNVDSPGFVGFSIPACAVTPPPPPPPPEYLVYNVEKAQIDCANFSSIFNPYGIKRGN